MTELKEKIIKHGISPESLIVISTNLHEQKKLGLFSGECKTQKENYHSINKIIQEVYHTKEGIRE